jgi:RNA-directed DNA polymerase
MPNIGQQHPKEKSQELQRRLYLAAKRSKERRFHALFDRIYRLDIMWRAWNEVKLNGGSAGVDGVTIEAIERNGVEAFLQEIIQQLKTGTYRPQPVKRVFIPKPDGKQRPLGIPIVKDRVVQQACKIVVEPIFEANFHDCSYGFRPKRSAGQVVKAIREALVFGWYVVDADIQGYFDNIDHEILMTLLTKRISDRRVLKLIQQWLKAGYIGEDGKKYPSEKGSPQGGVISPLLANIYLHVMDTYWVNQYQHLGKLYRYCDDFVIICPTQHAANKALEVIQAIMGRLKLTLHPEKTKVIYNRKEGFDFLGFHFHKKKSRTQGKLLPYFWPSIKAMKAIRMAIREVTGRNRLRQTPEEIIKRLNPIVRGWRNYFKIGHSTQKFKQLDNYIYRRLKRLAKARYKRKKIKGFITWYETCGVERFSQKGICAIKT